MLKGKKIFIAVAICAVVVGGTVAGIALSNHFSAGSTSAAASNENKNNISTTSVDNNSENKDTKTNDTVISSESKNDSNDKNITPVKKSNDSKSASSAKSSKVEASGTNSKTSVSKSTGLRQKYLNELASVSKDEEHIYYDLKHPKEGEPLTEGNVYSLWDNELNKIYGIVKKNISKKEFAQLEKSEMSWIKEKDKIKDINGLAKATKERCYYIVNNYMPK